MSEHKQVFAWHFVGTKLRDGKPIPRDGVALRRTGRIRLCEYGLHAGFTPWASLPFAPGNTLCYVKCSDRIRTAGEKLACGRRTIIARMDSTPLLAHFVRMQAVKFLYVLRPTPPDIVLDWLMTGDERLRGDVATEAGRNLRRYRNSPAQATYLTWRMINASLDKDVRWAARQVRSWVMNESLNVGRRWFLDEMVQDFNNLVYDAFAEVLQ